MQRSCDRCNQSYEAKRSTSKFCSADCRRAAHADAHGEATSRSVPVAALPAPSSAEQQLVASYRLRLEAAGRLDSPEGAHVLLLAGMLAAGGHTASGAAALSRELRAAMEDAVAGAAPSADALDELAMRRADKAAGA